MLKQNVYSLPITSFDKGLNTHKNFFKLELGHSPDCMDVSFNIDGSVARRLGHTSMNTTAMESTGGYGMFDFGIVEGRRLMCASGTGLYYSTDVGKTWVECATARSATLNSFSFVKNYCINTNDDYETPLYWTGSAGESFVSISTAAPQCKYSLTNQGYLIFLNGTDNARNFYYVDFNDMFTAEYDYFQLPTDRNDELTGGENLGKYLYVSSKYKIFRMIWVGGNPDWGYLEVKNWGFVPRTMKKVTVPNAGEVIFGLDWSGNLRAFNGVDDEIISDHFRLDNGITNFYLDKINKANLNKCWAEHDEKARIYRLYVAYGDSSTVTHCLNLDYRNMSVYPYSNQPFQSGILAEDTANGQHMVVCGYDGYVYEIDSGNTDVKTGINGYYTSPILYKNSPSRIQKSYQMDMYYKVTSSGELYYEDRTQFSNVFSLRKTFTLGSAISSIQIKQSVDVPSTFNVYQFKISNSANQAEPWQMNLIDYSHMDVGIGKP